MAYHSQVVNESPDMHLPLLQIQPSVSQESLPRLVYDCLLLLFRYEWYLRNYLLSVRVIQLHALVLLQGAKSGRMGSQQDFS